MLVFMSLSHLSPCYGSSFVKDFSHRDRVHESILMRSLKVYEVLAAQKNGKLILLQQLNCKSKVDL